MTTKTKTRLASVDVGVEGTPGSGASESTCEVFRLTSGRYEFVAEESSGSNQGYYQEDYSYGPWRGRGDSLAEARQALLEIVPEDHRESVARSSQEALYEAEDADEG